MGTPDIRLARIDNRMIHGQVAMMWTSKVQANLIIVVDDDVVKDDYQMQLMATAVPDGVQVRFFTVQKMLEVYAKASANQHLFIVTRTPIAMAQLISNGVPIPEVNIGNMHDGADKITVIPEFLYASEQEIQAIKEICDTRIKVYGQMSPFTANHDINILIKKF